MAASFPSTVVPAESEFFLQANTIVVESPFTRQMDIAELTGSRWVATLSFRHLTRAQAADLESFLNALHGRVGTFKLHNHARENPRGTGGGTPTVNGAGQTGRSLVTEGWNGNETVLKVGDFFSFDDELHQVVSADVSTGAGGIATIKLIPPIRTSPAHGVTVIVTRAEGVFRLNSDEEARPRHTTVLTDLTFTAVEVIP